VIDLTENQIEDIREHTKHRKSLRDKLEALRANRRNLKYAELKFKGEGGDIVMSQGPRGGFLNDMAEALERHLEVQIADLTHKLQALGVRVS
jgi:hypothetical protein